PDRDPAPFTVECPETDPARVTVPRGSGLQGGGGVWGGAARPAPPPGLFAAFRWAGAVVLLGWAVLALRRATGRAGAEAKAPALRAAVAVPAHATGQPPAGSAPPGGAAGDAGPSVRQAFGQGLLCTGSNPKVGIFLMAFLPQFVPAGMAPEIGVPVLAACYLALGLLWLLTWMRLVHRLAPHLRSPRVLRITDGLTAVVFGLFAVRLALGG
ncbi:LysE family translocator, partial [Streptomyces sp. NPDC059742]|uniref:LysE family translocator n=1 Tax=Streptomyces sp. NPDC059742 TaxID=3346927 RepID=UPI0036608933